MKEEEYCWNCKSFDTKNRYCSFLNHFIENGYAGKLHLSKCNNWKEK